MLFCGPLWASGPRTWWHSMATLASELAAQFMALAEKQGATSPLRARGIASRALPQLVGRLAEGRGTFDRALAIYDPAHTVRLRHVLVEISG